MDSSQDGRLPLKELLDSARPWVRGGGEGGEVSSSMCLGDGRWVRGDGGGEAMCLREVGEG